MFLSVPQRNVQCLVLQTRLLSCSCVEQQSVLLDSGIWLHDEQRLALVKGGDGGRWWYQGPYDQDFASTVTVAALVVIRAKMFPHGVPWWTDVCDRAVILVRHYGRKTMSAF